MCVKYYVHVRIFYFAIIVQLLNEVHKVKQ